MATESKDRSESELRNGDKPIALSFGSQTRVVVTPDNEDRFVVTSEKAAQACQFHRKHEQSQEEWTQLFASFLQAIHDWCAERTDTVSGGYVVINADGLRVFVLTKGPMMRFDEFADEVSEFDLQLHERFPDCPNDVIELPDEPRSDVESFVNVPASIQVFPQRASGGSTE